MFNRKTGYLIVSILIAALFFISTPVICSSDCGSIPPESVDWNSLPKSKSHYYNGAWGYDVRIPKGLIGRMNFPSSPQHGVGILLSKQPKAYIFVDGSANSLLFESVDKAAESEFENIKNEAVKVISKQEVPLKLNGQPAIRLIVNYECNNLNMTEDRFIIIDKREIVYTISLTAETVKYDEYKKVLQKIAHSFHLIKRI